MYSGLKYLLLPLVVLSPLILHAQRVDEGTIVDGGVQDAPPTWPESFVLPASDPVAEYHLEAMGIGKQDGVLAFTITPVFYPYEEAAAFMQGAGISLAFVEYEESKFIAAWSAKLGEEGGAWRFAKLSDYSDYEVSLEISFCAISGRCSVAQDGETLLDSLPWEKNAKIFTFFGDINKIVTFSSIELSSASSKGQISTEDTAFNNFKSASQLSDLKVTNGTNLIYKQGRLCQLSEVLRIKLSKMPKRLRDIAISSVVFLDNKNGNDSYDGKWVEYTGLSGPKKSYGEAYSAVPDGGVLVIMPGEEIYLCEQAYFEPKEMTIISIGDIVLGPRENITRLVYSGSEPRLLRLRRQLMNITHVHE